MADARKEPTSPEFLEHFASIADPRQAGKVLYPLNEIFLLVLCAVISGADGWTSIALYGRKKISLLRRFLSYEHGTPSHDQLGILFSRLDMEAFQRCFAAWVSSLHETFEGVVAIDGKTLRRSFDAADGKAAIHMIGVDSGRGQDDTLRLPPQSFFTGFVPCGRLHCGDERGVPVWCPFGGRAGGKK